MSETPGNVETEPAAKNDKMTPIEATTQNPVDSNAMDVDGNQNNCDSENNADVAQGAASSRTLKRKISETVITISDSDSGSTDSNDSSVCHIESYQISDDEAKRMRGDYSSSDAYSSEEDSPFEDSSIVLNKDTSTQSILTKHIAELKPRASRLENPALNLYFQTPDLQNELKKNWNEKIDYKTENLTLINDPFRVCLMNNFLSNPDMINNIVDDMNTLEWTRKKMDLYEFYQTTDLVNMTWQRSLKGMYDMLKNDVMKWVANVSETKLTHMSASCSLYGPTDYLLVHDDLLSDRRIAFIFYVAPWNIEKKIPTEKDASKIFESKDKTDTTKETKEHCTKSSDKKTDSVNNKIDSEVNKMDLDEKKIYPEANKIEDKKVNIEEKIYGSETEGKKVDLEEKTQESSKKTVDKEENKIEIEDEKQQNGTVHTEKEIKPEIVNNGEQIGWTEELGGALELFAMNEQKEPTVAVKQIIPNNNMFAFFKVGTDSYHQVAEVSSLDFPRLTINGWFHGPDPHADAAEHTTKEPEEQEGEVTETIVGEKPHNDIVLMNQWLCETYLLPRTRFKVQLQIEKQSEVSLEDFFLPQKYQQVMDVLRGDLLPWKRRGPANQRKYDTVTSEELTQLPSDNPVRELMHILCSNTFFKFLIDCTELSLKTYNNLELQRWTATSFTVLPPKESYSSNELDIIMYFGFPQKQFPGGATTYLAPEDANSEPLITIAPVNNALNIVYSDEGTARFMKYVSKLSMTDREYFYVVTSSYRE